MRRLAVRTLAGFGLSVLAWIAWVYVTTKIERSREEWRRHDIFERQNPYG